MRRANALHQPAHKSVALPKAGAAPICETTVLINFAACGFADEGFIAHRISKTAHHGGNLRVDGRRGDNAGLFVKISISCRQPCITLVTAGFTSRS